MQYFHPTARTEVRHMVSYGPEKSQVCQFQSVCVSSYLSPNVYQGQPVVRGVCIRRLIQESICDFSKETYFTRLFTGLSRVHHCGQCDHTLNNSNNFLKKAAKTAASFPSRVSCKGGYSICRGYTVLRDFLGGGGGPWKSRVRPS